MQLIDKYLPEFHFKEHHTVQIHKSVANIYDRMLQVNLFKSGIIKFLFGLRGIPAAGGTIKDLPQKGFKKLDEKVREEIIFGIISSSWNFNRCTSEFSIGDFVNRTDKNQIKAVINFRVTATTQGSEISTETRVLCGSKAMKKKFSIYWFFVGPFSRLTRMIILRRLKKELAL